jgi:hypothetical protein
MVTSPTKVYINNGTGLKIGTLTYTVLPQPSDCKSVLRKQE